MIRLLLLFMSQIDDTTLLHRNNLETLEEVKKIAGNLYQKKVLDYGELNEITNSFIKKRLSPGGSADMVILALILQKVIKNFKREEL